MFPKPSVAVYVTVNEEGTGERIPGCGIEVMDGGTPELSVAVAGGQETTIVSAVILSSTMSLGQTMSGAPKSKMVKDVYNSG